MSNLYVVVSEGGARSFCLGQDEAQTVYDRYVSDGKTNVRVKYITTLTDCTHDFQE